MLEVKQFIFKFSYFIYIKVVGLYGLVLVSNLIPYTFLKLFVVLSINLGAAFSYYGSATFKWLSIRICIVRSSLLNSNISQISVVSANSNILVISTAHNNIVSQYPYRNDIGACFVGNYNIYRTFFE